MKIVTVKREYRSDFSQAYKHLYKEGELSYLTEILDSAQEGNNLIIISKFFISNLILIFRNSLFVGKFRKVFFFKRSFRKWSEIIRSFS
jgi:hypothetical protein